MSVQAIRWAVQQRTDGIATKAALLVLADYANRTGSCWPAVTSLAAAACTDERTMRRLLGRLRDAGLITVEARRGRPSMYRLSLDTPGADPGVTPGSHPGPTPGADPDRGESPDFEPTPGRDPGDPGVRARGGRGDTPPNRNEPPENRRDPTSARPRPIPADWQPHPGHLRNAERRGADVEREATQFRNHALANDRRLADWDAGFDLWLGNAKPAHRPGSSLLPARPGAGRNSTDDNIRRLLGGAEPPPDRPAIGGTW